MGPYIQGTLSTYLNKVRLSERGGTVEKKKPLGDPFNKRVPLGDCGNLALFPGTMHIGRISKDKMNINCASQGKLSKIINFSVYPTTTDSFNPTRDQYLCQQLICYPNHF